MEDTQTKAALGGRPRRQLDALGRKDNNYDRDGLGAVAQFDGKAGMKKFVQSKGEYNPSDELATSLQEYYKRFSSAG